MTELLKSLGRAIVRIVLRLLRLALKALPLRQDVVLFESFPELGGSPRMIYDELRRRGLDRHYRLVWAVDAGFKAPPGVKCLPFYGKLGPWSRIRKEVVLAKSKAIVDSNRFVHKLKKSTFRMFARHGGMAKKCDRYVAGMGKVDCCLSLSENLREIEKEVFWRNTRRFAYLGYPENDLLFDKVDLYALGFWKRVTGRSGRFAKVIGWMPTYRQHRIDSRLNPGTTVFPFGLPLLRTRKDFQRLNALLQRENILLAIQMHHAQDKNYCSRGRFSHIVSIEQAVKDAMGVSNPCMVQGFDALVTDYSGVYQEFILLDRPMAISIDDYDVYSKNPGFVFDFFDWFKGEYLRTPEDLERFVENVARGRDPAGGERRAVLRKHHKYVDGQSTKRVTDFLCAEAGLRHEEERKDGR